jgi:type II secretory pathway pseudopilin PulG
MNFDTILTLLVIGSFAVSIISSLSKARSESEKRAQEQARLQRELQELERKRREGNPDTQSMQSYLERTRPGQLEDGQDDFAQPTRPTPRPGSFAADMTQAAPINEQERLRREMARKMGQNPSSQSSSRTTTSSSRPPQSLEEMLRDFTKAVENRPSQPSPASRPPSTQGRTSRPPAPTSRPASSLAPTTIESTIRPSIGTSSTLEPQGSVVNVSAAAAERAMALEREAQGASVVSRGSATRSWESATTGDIVRAVIWTEILNPPKSRRR